MKKSINWSGGRGYFVDDTLQNSDQLETIKSQMFTGLGAYIISGCQPKSGPAISEGLVCIDDRLIYVPETDVSSFPCWMKKGADVESGIRYYDIDAVNKNAFATEVIEIVYSEPASGEFIYYESASKLGKTFFNVANEKIRIEKYTDWQDLTLINGWAADTYTPRYKIDPFGFIRLRGRLDPSGASNVVFCDLDDMGVERSTPNFIGITPVSIYTAAGSPSYGYGSLRNVGGSLSILDPSGNIPTSATNIWLPTSPVDQVGI